MAEDQNVRGPKSDFEVTQAEREPIRGISVPDSAGDTILGGHAYPRIYCPLVSANRPPRPTFFLRCTIFIHPEQE